MVETFVVEQKPLLSILSSMQPICAKKTVLDITGSLLFSISAKELIVKGTDLEISLQSSYPLATSTFSEPKSFLVNGKRLFDITKELESDITFTLQNNQLLLSSGNVNLALNIKDAQEFPSFPERIENLMHLDAAFLLSLLDKVSFLIPQNNANPALNGLYLEISPESLRMTTTDGHCLAQVRTVKYTLEKSQQWLLPRRAVVELKKVIETSGVTTVFLGTCANQLVISGENFNFFTKLVSNPFPEYRPILDKKGFVPASIDRSSLVKTLKRSTCLLSGQFIATTFAFNESDLQVVMHNKEVGKLEEKLPMTNAEGALLSMKFYAPYLLSGLHAFTEPNLTFYLNTQTRPIIFETKDSSDYHLTYLVMPVSPSAA
jgi:DNA polymerase-3 subunit beta